MRPLVSGYDNGRNNSYLKITDNVHKQQLSSRDVIKFYKYLGRSQKNYKINF